MSNDRFGQRAPATPGSGTPTRQLAPGDTGQDSEPTRVANENTFPGLPVRENEEVFVWMSMFLDQTEHAQHVRALEQSSAWRDVSQALAVYLAGTEQVLRLAPTARSALHA
jgi:hypothetical protein